MENYICINGNKTELTEEQLRQLGIESPNKFSRIRERKFYLVSGDGYVYDRIENGGASHGAYFKAANYCTDKAMMEQRAMFETLNRRLWRYSEQNGGQGAYTIYRTKCNGSFKTIINSLKTLEPKFCSEIVAQRAIKEIVEPFMKEHPDFVW